MVQRQTPAHIEIPQIENEKCPHMLRSDSTGNKVIGVVGNQRLIQLILEIELELYMSLPII